MRSRLVVLALLVGLFAPLGEAAKPAWQVSVTPQAVDFGLVVQGGTSSRTVSITNTGKNAIELGGWGITAVPFTFERQNQATCPLTYRSGWVGHGPLLKAGQTCAMTVIAQAYEYGGSYVYPPGTYSGYFYMLDSNDVQFVRVPLTVTVYAA